jgi:putative Mg2+ transporter-C (MgtC) family protein
MSCCYVALRARVECLTLKSSSGRIPSDRGAEGKLLHDLNSYFLWRLILAGLLGGIIGLERQLRRKPAGIRTNMLICFGAALFTIISYEMAGDVGGDHTRIAAQIIPGIGFIGAGVVIRERGAVMGITSAATIFVMASIGMAVGAGMLAIAIFATLMVLVALVVIGYLENRLGLQTHLMTFQLSAPSGHDLLIPAHRIVERSGIPARRWQTHQQAGLLTIDFEAEITYQQERELLTQFGALNVKVEARPAQG